jgi:hypothetical protein
MRAIRARERLDFHDDINAGFSPKDHKMLRLELARTGYADDPETYRQYVAAIASSGGDSIQRD